MSDDYLRILPRDPRYVPTLKQQEAALAALRRFVPRADLVEMTVSDEVRFVGAGANFERVCCPRCAADITDWWPDAMEAAYASRFEELAVEMPCWGTMTSLNALIYDWPVGFARFVLEAHNASIGGRLPPSQAAEIQVLLGCTITQILAHC